MKYWLAVLFYHKRRGKTSKINGSGNLTIVWQETCIGDDFLFLLFPKYDMLDLNKVDDRDVKYN